LFRVLDDAFEQLDAWISRFLPEDLNPLAQTGAIVNTSLLVALLTGFLLLPFYKTSVHQAWHSLEAARSQPFTGQLIRSLHRYSSDVCMFFAILHALKLAAARRFVGPRWLAWVTGLVLVASLWLVGWLGYWLVWDERARQVALGTAKLVDVLPILSDPLSRSFLTDASVNTLFFFLVFFAHMLLPLAMGVALWLHITRLSRSRFLTKRKMTWAVLGALLLACAILPAHSVGPAKMAVTPGPMKIDAWYLLPLYVTDRLGGVWLWFLTAATGVLLFAVPWLLSRGQARPAQVIEARCNACRNCFADCPFDAIEMAPRTDGRNYDTVAKVDPNKCVGCGICAGSCDSMGIGLPWIDTPETRRALDAWLAGTFPGTEKSAAPPDKADKASERIAFVCAESAGATLRVDGPTGHCPELPGYRVLKVPCIGWVHALTIERALRHGAPGVLLVGCGEGDCRYREGAKWTKARLAGVRVPFLRTDKVQVERVRLIRHHRIARSALVRSAEAFLREKLPALPGPSRVRIALGTVLVGAALLAVLLAGSNVPYAGPPPVSAGLVVSFRHAGQAGEHCRDLSAEEIARQPKHMRQQRICERGRAPVRLRVVLDGQKVLERSYLGSGLRSDGGVVAVERIPASVGEHEVEIFLGDTPDEASFAYKDRRSIRIEPRKQTVVLFERLSGFVWQ